MAGKKITNSQLLGEKGIALISKPVSEIGYLWRPDASLITRASAH